LPRCPTCHRRIAASAPCPLDGWPSSRRGEETAAAPAEAPPPPPRLDGFEVSNLLGEGGFSLVWEASRGADGAAAALKVGRMDSALAKERFRRDAEAMALVGPPFAPLLFASGALVDGRPFIAMERLPGATLAAELEGRPAPPGAEWALTRAIAIAETLERAHARGVIHRDLKPENVVLCEAPRRAALIDFGAAKAASAQGDPGITRVGTVLGTTEYMAPEQIRGDADLDARADLYALGVILFEMLTLRLPFTGDRGSIEHGHLALRPPRPGDFAAVPEAASEIALACLAKERERRPADASAVRRALEEALAQLTAGTSPVSAPSSSSATPKSSELLAEGRQPVVILVADTVAPAVGVVAVVTGRKGVVARQAGTRYVCVFSGADTDDPVQTALSVARELVSRKSARAALHLSPVTMRRKARGAPVVYGVAVDRPATWLPEGGFRGVVLTAELARILPEGAVTKTALGPGFFALAEEAPVLSGIVPSTSAPLFGRDAIIAALERSARQSFDDGIPGLFTLIGDHGLGKSRLVAEAASLVRRRYPEARVIALRAPQPLAGGAGQTTRELLAQLLGVRGASAPMDPPAIARLCAEKLGPEIGEDAWLVASIAVGRVTPRSSGEAPRPLPRGVMRAVAAGLHRLARAGPVAVLVDDAHWADDAALDALEYATLNASDCPLWVLVTAHPRLEAARRGFGLRAGRPDRAVLDPLDEAAATRLAAELLLPAEYPPSDALEHLARWAGGNPFCLSELIGTLKRSGIVRKRPHAESYYVATTELDRLPPSPAWQWLAVKRLDALRPELSACVRLCSVLGAEFSRAEVEEVQDAIERAGGAGTPVDVGVGLTALVECGIFVRGLGERYSFQSATFRDAVCELLDAAHRASIHRHAFERWRAKIAEGFAGHAGLSQLARHAGAVGMREEAARAYLSLADIARSRHLHVEADQHASAALMFLDEGDLRRRALALAVRGKARYRVHRIREAVDDLKAARELAEALGDDLLAADLLLEEATALDWAHSFGESAARAEQARARLAGNPRPGLESRLLVNLGRSLFRQQRVAEAIDLLRRGAAGAEADADHDTRVVALLMLSSALVLSGSLDDAEARFQEVIGLCDEVTDRLHLGSAFANRALFWTAKNAPERALEDLRRAIQLAREVGNPWLERNATHNVAELLYWGGQDDEALALARRSRVLEERFVERLVPDDSLLLARIHAARGEHDEASRLLDWICERCATDALAPTERAFVRALSLVLARGDVSAGPGAEPREGAGADAGAAPDWDALVEEAARAFPAEELLEVLYFRAIAALRNDRRPEAVVTLQQASRRLDECPIWRPRFMDLAGRMDALLVPAGSQLSGPTGT
jgi:tetratricopeptide (TPR) repeat protein